MLFNKVRFVIAVNAENKALGCHLFWEHPSDTEVDLVHEFQDLIETFAQGFPGATKVKVLQMDRDAEYKQCNELGHVLRTLIEIDSVYDCFQNKGAIEMIVIAAYNCAKGISTVSIDIP